MDEGSDAMDRLVSEVTSLLRKRLEWIQSKLDDGQSLVVTEDGEPDSINNLMDDVNSLLESRLSQNTGIDKPFVPVGCDLDDGCCHSANPKWPYNDKFYCHYFRAEDPNRNEPVRNQSFWIPIKGDDDTTDDEGHEELLYPGDPGDPVFSGHPDEPVIPHNETDFMLGIEGREFVVQSNKQWPKHELLKPFIQWLDDHSSNYKNGSKDERTSSCNEVWKKVSRREGRIRFLEKDNGYWYQRFISAPPTNPISERMDDVVGNYTENINAEVDNDSKIWFLRITTSDSNGFLELGRHIMPRKCHREYWTPIEDVCSKTENELFILQKDEYITGFHLYPSPDGNNILGIKIFSNMQPGGREYGIVENRENSMIEMMAPENMEVFHFERHDEIGPFNFCFVARPWIERSIMIPNGEVPTDPNRETDVFLTYRAGQEYIEFFWGGWPMHERFFKEIEDLNDVLDASIVILEEVLVPLWCDGARILIFNAALHEWCETCNVNHIIEQICARGIRELMNSGEVPMIPNNETDFLLGNDGSSFVKNSNKPWPIHDLLNRLLDESKKEYEDAGEDRKKKPEICYRILREVRRRHRGMRFLEKKKDGNWYQQSNSVDLKDVITSRMRTRKSKSLRGRGQGDMEVE